MISSENRVVLFGTKGGPRIIKGGSWPTSNALLVKDKLYIIDAGLGVTRQFVEAGFDYSQLETIFITHHHSDHTLELGGLIYTAWVGAAPHPISVFAPSGVGDMVAHFLNYQRFDIDIRIADEALHDIKDLIHCYEFNEGDFNEGVIYEDAHVKVTALRVQHPPVTDCYALKFETDTAIIVFGADTAYFPPLAEFAKGADILIHEAMHLPTARQICDLLKDTKPRLWAHFLASHTACEDVGRIATAAQCKKLVVNHFVPEIGFYAEKEDFESAIKTSFDGEVIIGYDGLSIPF